MKYAKKDDVFTAIRYTGANELEIRNAILSTLPLNDNRKIPYFIIDGNICLESMIIKPGMFLIIDSFNEIDAAKSDYLDDCLPIEELEPNQTYNIPASGSNNESEID